MKKLFIASVLLLSMSSFAQKTVNITNTVAGHTMQVIRIATKDVNGDPAYYTGSFSPTLSLTTGSSYSLYRPGGTTKFPFDFVVLVGFPDIPTWVKTADSFAITNQTKIVAYADVLATDQVFSYALISVDGGTPIVCGDTGGVPTPVGGYNVLITHPIGNETAIVLY